MHRKCRLYRGLCTSVFVLSLLTMRAHGTAQELTPHDINRILLEAERSFAQFVHLWKEGRFAELYTYGTFASQADLSPEAFEYHMGHATRTLQCCWQTIQDIQSRFESPERVYIKARLGFKHREFLVVHGQHRFIARGFLVEETLTFLLQHEDQAWRLDLFRILALSGVPLELPGAAFFHWRR